MCEDCREQNLKRKREQFEEPKVRPIKKGGYDSKSKKVWRDRFLARRADLKRAVQWYADAHKRGWYDDWGHERLERNGWYAKRYREARAEAKRRGAI
jgi:hypothetical protein